MPTKKLTKVEILTLGMSVAALIVALFSLWTDRQALKLNQEQESMAKETIVKLEHQANELRLVSTNKEVELTGVHIYLPTALHKPGISSPDLSFPFETVRSISRAKLDDRNLANPENGCITVLPVGIAFRAIYKSQVSRLVQIYMLQIHGEKADGKWQYGPGELTLVAKVNPDVSPEALGRILDGFAVDPEFSYFAYSKVSVDGTYEGLDRPVPFAVPISGQSK